jgi:soluble lytic murein transglycosylase-like protein
VEFNVKTFLFAVTLFIGLAAGVPTQAQTQNLEQIVYSFCAKEFSKQKALEKSKFYTPIIRKYAKKYDLPEVVVASIIWHESNFKPYLVSPAGALGLMQVMPFHFKPHERWQDPSTNINVGCRILKGYSLRFHGDLHRALTAYCYGPFYVANRGMSRSHYSKAVLKHR